MALEAAAEGKKRLFTDSEGLVILDRHNKLSRLILQQCHDRLGHAGHCKTLTKSRQWAWIAHGRLEAMKVVHIVAWNMPSQAVLL